MKHPLTRCAASLRLAARGSVAAASRSAACAALLAAAAACEANEPPSANAPQNASMDVPPPPPALAPQAASAPAGPAESTASGGAEYASAEYAVGENTDAYNDNDPSALNDFRETLDPYGSWVDDRTYGTVWVPAASAVGADFAPYSTAGHWVYDDDWTWVSDYPWGWAPFHYGRWVLIEGRGWSWIPGRVYRGAWVNWAVDDGYSYVGWAPLGPDFVWFAGIGVAWGLYVVPHWVYCPRGEVFSPAVGAHVVSGAAAAPIAGRMRTFVAATPGVGPAPARMGFAASQVPHATGAAAQSIARAQSFSRPSTAQSLGGSPAMRVAAPLRSGSTGPGARPAVAEPQGPSSPARVGPAPGAAAAHPSTFAPAPHAAPQPFHSAPSPHTGGGGHHR